MTTRPVAIVFCLVFAAAAPGARQSPDDATPDRVQEFAAWAHPSCSVAAPPSIVERFPGGLRADYDLVCGGRTDRLGALLLTREGEKVWQVVEGFEASRDALDAIPDSTARPLAPPGETGPPRPELRGVDPPRVIDQVLPEYPEEASRARLFGDAKVQLLVAVSAEGVPERIRPLRGPDPDLGMHGAAAAAVLRWRFQAAVFRGRPVRYFAPIEISFQGLPPESRSWTHRALFRVEAIVSADRASIESAGGRLRNGASFTDVVAGFQTPAGRAGDWGFVSAATLPLALRQALHDAPTGGAVGPLTADGLTYLMLKRGEIYYTLRPPGEGELTYQIDHQVGAPEGEALRRIVQDDVRDYLAESRRSTYVNEAARLMGLSQRLTEIGRLKIYTDVLDDEEVRLLGDVVQATIEAHRQFWGPLVPLRPLHQPILVYAFARAGDHDRLHAIWQTGTIAEKAGPAPAGEYVPSSRLLAIPCEAMGGHLPIPILIHETVHMLDFETVFGAGVTPSEWFEEGLATFFGFSQFDSRLRIQPGDIRRTGTVVSGSVRMQFDPRAPLRDYRRRVRKGEVVPLRALVAAGPSDPIWGGESASNAYGAAWTLVHFLKEGAKGERRARFESFARREARGEGGPAAFTDLFGPDLDALEAAWREYEDGL